MRKTAIVLTLLFGIVLYAGADSTVCKDDKVLNRMGIGISLETLMTLDPYGNSSGGKVFLPFKFKNSLIEPMIGVYHLHRTQSGYNEQEEWIDFRTYTIGLGCFTLKKVRNVDWMFGFRLEKQWQQEDSNLSYNDGLEKSSELILSPTIAAEYVFDGGFSISGEVSLDNGSFQQDQNNYSYSSQRTKTTIMLRYYLGSDDTR